jgi:hypothetical protein
MKLHHSILTLCLAFSGSALAQNTIEIDPVDALTDFTSLAEWETNDDFEGWTVNQLPAAFVEDGRLIGTTDGGDTQIRLNPLSSALPAGAPSIVTIEVKVKRLITDTSLFQLFWAAPGSGFSAPNSLTIPGVDYPADGLDHVVRFTVRNIATALNAVRVDASQTNGATLEFGYVRVKIASGAPVLDPPQLVNLYTSLAEFNTAGDQEGWVGNNINGISVAQGKLSGLTAGNDPQLQRTGLTLDSTTGDFQIIEIRARKPVGETSRVDLFWADTAGGFAANRKATVAQGVWPDDGKFHIFQATLGDFFTETVNALRFDPVADLATAQAIEVDYIRIGQIATDTDMDGLADVVETNTGIWNGPLDTGTDPNDAFSDSDAFNDGVEVAFGTDPNNGDEFPQPVVSDYTVAPATYLRAAVAADNSPVVELGTALGFSVSPALPNGLNLDANTGVISGTPDTATAAADYTITADFGNGITDDFVLTISVSDPGIVRYGVNPAVYNLGAAIVTNSPVLFGPAPDSFSVSPALPDGLFLDGSTGDITGAPTVVTPATDYSITASYTALTDSTAVVSIRTKAIPVYIGSDGTPISPFTSLGEWNTDGDNDGWGFTNANGVAVGGILTFNATAPDPQMARGALAYDPAGGSILEVRMKQSDTDEVQIFWGDTANGGASPVRRTSISPSQIIADGQFHIYQISFTEVFDGDLTFLRVDPGGIGGRSVEIDYIRIGSAGVPQGIMITNIVYDGDFGEATITWTSDSGKNYRIDISSDLVDWTSLVPSIAGDAGTTNFTDDDVTTVRFYRVVDLSALNN